MQSLTDDQDVLLAQIAEGDRAALRRLYDVAAPRLLGIAMRMLRRRDLAEDALQEAFVAIWSDAARFDPALGHARAWMATILRRKAIDRMRATPWLRRKDDLAEPPAVPEDDPHALAVRECLDRLGDTQRKALLHVYYFGLTHEELSHRLGKPLGTVKSWVRRGLIDMKTCLEA